MVQYEEAKGHSLLQSLKRWCIRWCFGNSCHRSLTMTHQEHVQVAVALICAQERFWTPSPTKQNKPTAKRHPLFDRVLRQLQVEAQGFHAGLIDGVCFLVGQLKRQRGDVLLWQAGFLLFINVGHIDGFVNQLGCGKRVMVFVRRRRCRCGCCTSTTTL